MFPYLRLVRLGKCVSTSSARDLSLLELRSKFLRLANPSKTSAFKPLILLLDKTSEFKLKTGKMESVNQCFYLTRFCSTSSSYLFKSLNT